MRFSRLDIANLPKQRLDCLSQLQGHHVSGTLRVVNGQDRAVNQLCVRLAEIWFSLLNARAIRRGAFKNVGALREAIQRFLNAWNENCQPFKWVKTAPQILVKTKPKGFKGPGH